MKSTRRRFLLGVLGVTAVAGIGVLAFGRPAAEAQIVAAIRRRLNFLKLDEAGLHAFAHDQIGTLLAKRPTLNRIKYHFLSNVAKSYTRYARSTDHRTRMERIEDGFAATYLLSSDFFLQGADRSRVVQYVAYYDPLRACGNPFARPVVVDRPVTS
jgi:hypothetical protein